MTENSKLIASAVLAGAGGIGLCVASGASVTIPLIILVVGLVLMIKCWTGSSMPQHMKRLVMWVKNYDDLDNRMKEVVDAEGMNEALVKLEKKPVAKSAAKKEDVIVNKVSKSKEEKATSKATKKPAAKTAKKTTKKIAKKTIKKAAAKTTTAKTTKKKTGAKAATEKKSVTKTAKTTKKSTSKTVKKPVNKTAKKTTKKTPKKPVAKSKKSGKKA